MAKATSRSSNVIDNYNKALEKLIDTFVRKEGLTILGWQDNLEYIGVVLSDNKGYLIRDMILDLSFNVPKGTMDTYFNEEQAKIEKDSSYVPIMYAEYLLKKYPN